MKILYNQNVFCLLPSTLCLIYPFPHHHHNLPPCPGSFSSPHLQHPEQLMGEDRQDCDNRGDQVCKYQSN